MARFKVTIGYRDDKGRSGNFRYYLEVPAAFPNPLPEIEEHGQLTATLLDQITGGRVKSISAAMVIPRPVGIKAIPDVTSDIEERARIFYTNGTKRVYKGEIPAFNHDILPPGSETFEPFDPAIPDLQAFTLHMTNISTPGFTVFTVNQYGDVLDGADLGLRIFRK